MRQPWAVGLMLAGLVLCHAAAAQTYAPYQQLGRTPPLTRIMEYEGGGLRRLVRIDGRLMTVLIHPREPSLLVQRNPGGALLQGAAEGLSLGTVPAALPENVYERAALAVLRPAGCRLTDLRSLDGRVSWEAVYACPGGRLVRR